MGRTILLNSCVFQIHVLKHLFPIGLFNLFSAIHVKCKDGRFAQYRSEVDGSFYF